MACEVLASIEIAAIADPNLRFISSHEILLKAPEATRNELYPFRIPYRQSGRSSCIVPDGIFGLEYARDGRKSYRFFALEVDRATMPVMRSNLGQTSYTTKMLAYREIIARNIYKSYLGLPNLLVLTVTINERHKDQIMNRLGELAGSSTAFLFKTTGDLGSLDTASFPMPEILTVPWQRIGLPSLAIHIAH